MCDELAQGSRILSNEDDLNDDIALVVLFRSGRLPSPDPRLGNVRGAQGPAYIPDNRLVPHSEGVMATLNLPNDRAHELVCTKGSERGMRSHIGCSEPECSIWIVQLLHGSLVHAFALRCG